MRRIFLLLLLLFPSLSMSEGSSSKLFIMLDIDNTLLDKIALKDNAANESYAAELKEKGLLVQKLDFYSVKGIDPFFDFYKKKKNSRMEMDIESEDKIKITETIVVRPSMKSFLEKLSHLNIPTYILICSRSGNERVKNLVEKLNLKINNKAFKDVVDFVPRENFRVDIKSGNGYKVIGKSAWDLRQKYSGKFGKIKESDYVVLIDQLEDHQFIYSNIKRDMNITISPFYSRSEAMISETEDDNTMELAIERIRDFIK